MEGAAEQSAAAADAVQGGETERYFLPLRLACESKVARVMEVRPSPRFAARRQRMPTCFGRAHRQVALHCIQKLIAYGYVRGKIVMVGNVKKWLVDVVMDTVMLRPPRAPAARQLRALGLSAPAAEPPHPGACRSAAARTRRMRRCSCR